MFFSKDFSKEISKEPNNIFNKKSYKENTAQRLICDRFYTICNTILLQIRYIQLY